MKVLPQPTPVYTPKGKMVRCACPGCPASYLAYNHPTHRYCRLVCWVKCEVPQAEWPQWWRLARLMEVPQ